MLARRLEILRRQPKSEIILASPRDFRTRPAAPVDPETLLTDPNLSLYCIDPAQRSALFVWTPAAARIADQPFLYQAQYQHAQYLVTVGYDGLERLAPAAMARIRRLAFLFSVGRCGSTLVSRMLSAVPNVVSLSEPDVYTQLVLQREPDGSRDDELVELARWATPFVFGNSSTTPIDLLVIKPRSFCTEIAPLLWRAFPEMSAVFMYRHGEEVIASFLRMLDGRVGVRLPRSAWPLRLWMLLRPKARRNLHRMVPLLHEHPLRDWLDAGLAGPTLAHWVSVLHRYLALYEEGRPIVALRYEDLMADSAGMLGALFDWLKLPRASLSAAQQFMTTDSQAGTKLAREPGADAPQLTSDELARIRALLARLPKVRELDMRLPGGLAAAAIPR